MIIRHNLSALNLTNQMNIMSRNQSKALEKLSSGFRINRAADDASGLAISEKMRAQIRGLDQAQSNAQDGVSLIQVAEGALNEIQGCIQRAKELATRAANGSFVSEDRQSTQAEIDSLLKEVNHIADNTNFNNIKLLDGSCYSTSVSASDKDKFMGWLNGSWLNDAAKKINDATGWSLNSGTTLSVTFKSAGDKAVATMSGTFLGKDLTLTINEDFMSKAGAYQGKNGPVVGGFLADRLITHEMVHGLMFNNVSSKARPDDWFVEGLAEAVHGTSDCRYAKFELGYETDFKEINNEIQSFDFNNSAGKDENYTVGYLATSYLYNQVEGHAAGSFKTMMGEMNETDETFQQLVTKYTGTNYATLISNFKSDAQSAMTAGKFNDDFLKAKCGIDLSDGLADPLDGTDLSASAVIPNSGSESSPSAAVTTLNIGGTDVTVNWNEISSPSVGGIVLQIGDTKDQTLKVSIKSAKTSNLGIDNLSVKSKEDAYSAIDTCKDAINTVSEMRSSLGAYQNRLEHAMSGLSNTLENAQSSESRIRDLDMAKEMTTFMKTNVLTQASQFLFAQVNQRSSQVLQLLN